MLSRSIILTAFVLPIVVSVSKVGWLLNENVKKSLEFEQLKKMEIERIKALMLHKFGLTDLPEISDSSSRLSDDVIQLLLEKVEQPALPNKHLARLLLLPSNHDFECLRYKVSSCRRFEYSIPQNAMYFTSEFWVYKQRSSPLDDLTISALCYHPEMEKEKVLEHDFLSKEHGEEKWLSIQLPLLRELKHWEGDLNCAVEITGLVIREDENNLPFLKMTQDLDEAHFRHRRTLDKNGACRAIPFQISFDEIGMGDYVIYPKSFDANLCEGYCLQASTFHEILVDHVFQTNATLVSKYGRCWSTCCRPKEYKSLRMIRREVKNGNDSYIDEDMVNMIVESCWCNK